jgi:hypothetical protein
VTDPVRDNLLGYLLDALEDDERQEVEDQLLDNTQLQRELSNLQKRVEPLGMLPRAVEPPVGLADRTCAFVDEALCNPQLLTAPEETERTEVKVRPRSGAVRGERLSPVTEFSSRTHRWTLLESVCGLGVCMVTAMLFFPALYGSWVTSQRIQCEDNLRSLGLSLAEYSDQRPDGRLPYIPAEGNRSFAGWFAQELDDNGYLPDSRMLVCPSSKLAEDEQWRFPSIEEIDAASDSKLVKLQKYSGGSYGFTIGYVENGVHKAAVNKRRAHYALMADAPSWKLGRASENHGGRGQNILFEDLRVQFVVGCQIDSYGDDIFLNRQGLVSAGLDPNDSVIGDALTAPFISDLDN